jgi:hypothetical protein
MGYSFQLKRAGDTMVNGKRVKFMERGFAHGLTGQPMMANGLTGISVVSGNSLFAMALSARASSLTYILSIGYDEWKRR